MEKFPILLMTIILPFISAIYIVIFVKQSRNPEKYLFTKYVAILSSVFTLVSSIFLLTAFDFKSPHYQYVETYSMLRSVGLELELGVDGISIFFVFLTALLTLISITVSMHSITKSIKEFLVCFLILEGLAIGVFCSLNLLLFYIFFEAILIPMYIIIGMWGGKNRIYATIKFFIYTLFGSVLFLISIIYLFNKFGTLSIPVLVNLVPTLELEIQIYLWLASFIAFAVKVPMFPFHTWLPDAHVQAPTAGSVILAGILLKIGGYGFLRVSIPMFPAASEVFAPMMMTLSIIAIIYASLVAIAQTDMKKMIAYSSIAHMGYVTAGLFSFSKEGISGAITQMISHGIVSSALFIIVGFLYDRLQTKEIASYGGVAKKMPTLATFLLIFVLASIGMPGTSGFVGELYSLIGMFKAGWYYAAFASLALILGAIYMLRLYRDVMLGTITNDSVENFKDLTGREIFCLMPLILLTLLMGVIPGVVTKFYAANVASIVDIISTLP